MKTPTALACLSLSLFSQMLAQTTPTVSSVAVYTKPSVADTYTAAHAGTTLVKADAAGNSAMPNFGAPAGYGMMQLDPPPSASAIWDWRANIAGGIDELQVMAGPPTYTNESDLRAYPFWMRQVKQWQDYNTANPTQQVAAPADQPESSCTFRLSATQTSSSPYWFGDAILIKQYNGAPTNYISWNNKTDPPTWSFNKGNSVSPNTVFDVCTSSTPTTCQHNH